MNTKKSPWPKAIIAFFAVVFAANWLLIYLAISGFEGLVEEDYYEKGLRYNDTVQQEKRLGWKIELSFADDLKTTDSNKAKVVIFDKAGMPIGGAKVKVVLRRPATDRFDREFEMVPSGCAYHGTLSIPVNGLWDLHVKAEKGGDRMEKNFRVRTISI
jgi:nitrogen fixation protein FixH